MNRIILALAACLAVAGCGGGETQPNNTCTYQGQTFTSFILCPGSTVCCPSYDSCSVIVGGGYSCTAR
jgi:hypothetical protein